MVRLKKGCRKEEEEDEEEEDDLILERKDVEETAGRIRPGRDRRGFHGRLMRLTQFSKRKFMN